MAEESTSTPPTPDTSGMSFAERIGYDPFAADEEPAAESTEEGAGEEGDDLAELEGDELEEEDETEAEEGKEEEEEPGEGESAGGEEEKKEEGTEETKEDAGEGEEKEEEGEKEEGEKETEAAASSDDTETRTVKINGEERTVTIADLTRDYQLREASNAKMQQAKKLEEAAKFVVGRVEENPFKAWQQLAQNKGMSRAEAEKKLLDLAQEHFTPIVQEDDDARKARHEREELEDEKRRVRSEKEQLEAEKIERQRQKTQTAFEADLEASMKAAGLDSKEERLVTAVCELLLSSQDAGIEMTIPEAAKQVAQKRDKAIEMLVETLSPDELQSKYPEVAKKIAQRNVAEAKKRRSSRSTSSQRRTARAPTQAAGRDFFHDLREEILREA